MYDGMNSLKKILRSLFYISVIFFIGVLGYMYLEKWNFSDSLFFTAITLSTVGYNIPDNIRPITKYFTIAIIFSGLTFFIYGLSVVSTFIIEGEIKNIFEGRKRMKKISMFENHFIIVGAGKTSSYVLSMLINSKNDFVIIDKKEENIKRTEEFFNMNFEYIVGDVKDEEIIKKCNIEKAKTAILTLPSDVDNLYAALTLKTLNPKINVVSKVNEPENVKKMEYAGIDKVVLTSEIAGGRLAQLALKPNMVSFLESITKAGDIELHLEEIEIPKNSWMNNKTLKDIALPRLVDIIVIAVMKKGRETIFNPSAVTVINEEDIIVVLAKESKIAKLKDIIKKQEV
ncbi:MAG: potassium channel protein [Thermotogae bacterium]|nr:potassium channel protein [Thermotogota bacterium]